MASGLRPAYSPAQSGPGPQTHTAYLAVSLSRLGSGYELASDLPPSHTLRSSLSLGELDTVLNSFLAIPLK